MSRQFSAFVILALALSGCATMRNMRQSVGEKFSNINTSMEAQNRHREQIDRVLSDWPVESRAEAQRLMRWNGLPQDVHNDRLVWYNESNGQAGSIILMRDKSPTSATASAIYYTRGD